MPNLCSNNLTITGDAATLKELDAKYFTPHFSFGKVIPMPDELSKTTAPSKDDDVAAQMLKKFGAPDWYLWAISKWGTKWEIDPSEYGYNEKSYPSDTEITISFDTAWSPPIPVIRELSRLFPSLEFSLKYFEPGCGFAGDFTAHNGSENDDCFEDADSDEYREMAEFFGWDTEEDLTPA